MFFENSFKQTLMCQKKVKNVITIPKPSHEWDKQDKRKHN